MATLSGGRQPVQIPDTRASVGARDVPPRLCMCMCVCVCVPSKLLFKSKCQKVNSNCFVSDMETELNVHISRTHTRAARPHTWVDFMSKSNWYGEWHAHAHPWRTFEPPARRSGGGVANHFRGQRTDGRTNANKKLHCHCIIFFRYMILLCAGERACCNPSDALRLT